MSFAGLELSEPLLRAVQGEGYEIATPIQIAAIPPLSHHRSRQVCPLEATHDKLWQSPSLRR